MKKLIPITVVAGLVALSQGCATVTRGTSQDFAVTSEPNNAQVKLSTGMTCETPCNLDLKRKKGFSGTVSKEGHKSVGFTVESKVSGGGGAGFAGNVVVGGIIGMGVDAASGAMKDLKPSRVHAVLVKEDSSMESRIEIPEPPKKTTEDENKDNPVH